MGGRETSRKVVHSGILLGFVAAGSSSLIGFSPNHQPWTIDLRERLLWAFWGFILWNLPKNLCRLLVLVPTCTVLWILWRELLKLGFPSFLNSSCHQPLAPLENLLHCFMCYSFYPYNSADSKASAAAGVIRSSKYFLGPTMPATLQSPGGKVACSQWLGSEALLSHYWPGSAGWGNFCSLTSPAGRLPCVSLSHVLAQLALVRPRLG